MYCKGLREGGSPKIFVTHSRMPSQKRSLPSFTSRTDRSSLSVLFFPSAAICLAFDVVYVLLFEFSARLIAQLEARPSLQSYCGPPFYEDWCLQKRRDLAVQLKCKLKPK